MIMKQLLTNLIFLGKMKINNYKFQQQQKAKQEHKEAKKIKEAAKKAPVSAAEELDYIKKLLNGEDVEDFGPEEVELIQHDGISVPSYWSQANPQIWIADPSRIVKLSNPNMSFADYVRMMNGEGYYK